jgi:Fe2+ or Zn2+ uptake regulation protein
MTAGHLHLELTRRNRPMRLSTICRCLDTMESRGIVTRELDSTRQVSRAKYYLLSRRRSTGACRFHCRCCGKSAEVNDAALFKALQKQTCMLDFLPFAEVLRIESLCAQCAHFSGITF